MTAENKPKGFTSEEIIKLYNQFNQRHDLRVIFGKLWYNVPVPDVFSNYFRDTLSMKVENGSKKWYPILTEKSKHIGVLIAKQREVKNTGSKLVGSISDTSLEASNGKSPDLTKLKDKLLERKKDHHKISEYFKKLDLKNCGLICVEEKFYTIFESILEPCRSSGMKITDFIDKWKIHTGNDMNDQIIYEILPFDLTLCPQARKSVAERFLRCNVVDGVRCVDGPVGKRNKIEKNSYVALKKFSVSIDKMNDRSVRSY